METKYKQLRGTASYTPTHIICKRILCDHQCILTVTTWSIHIYHQHAMYLFKSWDGEVSASLLTTLDCFSYPKGESRSLSGWACLHNVLSLSALQGIPTKSPSSFTPFFFLPYALQFVSTGKPLRILYNQAMHFAPGSVEIKRLQSEVNRVQTDSLYIKILFFKGCVQFLIRKFALIEDEKEKKSYKKKISRQF